MNLGTLTITTAGNPTFNGGAIVNNGLISKTSGDTNIVNAPVQNGGTISVSAGVLQLAGGGSYTGDLNTSGGGVLNLSGGVHNFNAGATVSAGILTVGGTINFNVANSNLAGFQLLGTAQGSGSANIGTFLWAGNGATIGGSVTITAANLQIQNVGAFLYMGGTGSLVSTGLTSAWTANGGYSVNLGTANTYTNSGLLTINTIGNPSWNGGTWINTGTITKTSSDTNSVSAVLVNSGTIDSEGGVLSFTHGDNGMTLGTFHAGSGGTILLGGNFTVSAPGAFSGPGIITVQSGKLTLNQSQRINDTQFTIAGSVSAWAAVIDVTTKALVFQTTGSTDKSTKMTRLLNQMQTARGNNTWLGNGITSSSAIADPTHKGVVVVDNAFLGLTSLDSLPVDSSSILVEATYMGDSNLDRKVDVTDLGTLATNYGKSVPGGIAQGDFNGDGKVDVTDLGILATDYGLGTGGQPFTVSTAPAPEPTSLLLLAAPLALRLRRRASGSRREFAILDS
jgi:fibronectin-binding autotransporter adhesin